MIWYVHVNERLMTLKIPTDTKNRFLHIIGVYAPTLPYDDNTKEVFYSQLNQCIRTVPKEDKLLMIMGDFNARVGTDHTAWPDTLGRHGVGNATMQQQWFASAYQVCAAQPSYHQHFLPNATEEQNLMDASPIKEMAPA